jgi:hypothetical protein
MSKSSQRVLILFAVLLVWSGTALAATFSIGQTGDNGSNTNAVTITLTGATTTGSAIIVSMCGTGTPTFSAPTDGSNTYNIVSSTIGAAFRCVLYWAINATGVSSVVGHVAVGATAFPEYSVMEVKGLNAAPTLDVASAGATGTGTTSNSANTATTAQADEFICSFSGELSNANPGSGSANSGSTTPGTVNWTNVTAGSNNSVVGLRNYWAESNATGTYGSQATTANVAWASKAYTFIASAPPAASPCRQDLLWSGVCNGKLN